MTDSKDVKNKLFFLYAKHLVSGKQKHKRFGWDYDSNGKNVSKNLGLSISEKYTVICEEVKELPLKEYMLPSFKKLTKSSKQKLLDYLKNGVIQKVTIYRHIDDNGYEYWNDDDNYDDDYIYKS